MWPRGEIGKTAMRMWVNSLGIPGVFIHNLQDDMKDGIVLLKIIDKIAPGTVAWAKVNKEPKSVYKKGENCNLVITYGLHLGFSLVGICGRDFVDGNRKYILAIVWQLMQYHLISILCSFSSNKKRINERDIILWANAMVNSPFLPFFYSRMFLIKSGARYRSNILEKQSII